MPDKVDSFRPQWEWSALEPAPSQTKGPVAAVDKQTAIPTPSLIRSGGLGDEIESPVQDQTPGRSSSTFSWQPGANKVMYAADVARIVSHGESGPVTGPLPPAVVQWEPAPYSVTDHSYSPEVFPAVFEDSEPESFGLEERDDDVDP